jgi:hypothetical protein
MSTITLVITSVLAAALVGFILLLLLRIRNNVVSGLSYRKALQAEISDLRLDRMLAALGINRERYLYQESTLDIHRQIERCKDCSNTATCDDKLSSNTIEKDKIDFCNNADAFGRISEQQGKPES